MSAHSELLKAVSAETGTPQNDVDRVMRGVATVVKASLAQGKDVRLFGLGKFYIVARKARIGRNNMTGDGCKEVAIPARKGIKFKPLTVLVTAVRGE